MNFKKVLIIFCSIIFFFFALTVYLNQIIFPRLIKKIAIERIEQTIHRKVEIESIHFSWFKGFIVDKLKVYEKDSNELVFAQADQVSFGIIYFPSLKHCRVTIPFINVRYPAVRLIRTSQDTWNFSDLLQTASAPSSIAVSNDKTPPLQIAWGGITINDGKLLVNDISNQRQWSEFFDNINLKLSLSYKGISYAFTADIPDKKGLVGATVYYQPITKETQAQIHLKNIDTVSYLSLINIPDIHLKSGIIKEIDLDINYAQNKILAKGDVLMKDLNITNEEQNFKGDIEIHRLNASYEAGQITARGQMNLTHIQTRLPGLSAGGSIESKVEDLEITPQGSLSFNGSLEGQGIFVNLKDRHVRVDEIRLDDIKIKKDTDGIQSIGGIKTKGLFIQWPDQELQGDISFNTTTLRMKSENNISMDGQLQADNLISSSNGKTFSSKHLLLDEIHLSIQDKMSISFNTKLELAGMHLVFDKTSLSADSLKTNRLFFNLNDGIIKASSTINATTARLSLGNQRTIEGAPQLEINLQMPLNNPQDMTYKGSITISDAKLAGFTPFQNLNNIELDADFQNDLATINALSINILDTNVRFNGIVKNFKNPYLNITADADELNLAKIKDVFPQIVEQFGLSLIGNSFVKVKFEGLIANPLEAKILAIASMKNVSMNSSKLHVQVNKITGIIEATFDSLQWRDFTATYLGKRYNLVGSLRHFKDPRVITSLDGPNLHLKADLVKNRDLITINTLTGNFYDVHFDTTGTLALYDGKDPFLDINTSASLLINDLLKKIPLEAQKNIKPLDDSAMIKMNASLKGRSWDWRKDTIHAEITSPTITLFGYKLNDNKITLEQANGKINNLYFDSKFYDGIVHAVGSMDLLDPQMPYDLAFNIDKADLHLFKMDSPFKMNEVNGKFFFTSLLHGTIKDFKNKLHATGSMAVRDGYLGEFNLFKGILDILNDAMNLGKIVFTDAEANFTIDDQKVKTENLRLKGPTIVLLGKGWVNFDQTCDLNMMVDLSSGAIPAIAHDVLKSINIHIYDKISNPKFGKKISVPQVLNTLLKNLWQ